MISTFNVKSIQFFKGHSADLNDKTAIVKLSWEGEFPDWVATQLLLRQKASTLRLSDPLYGIKETDWPNAFVINFSEPSPLSHWIIALSIGLQRWACEPAWKGKVVNPQEKNQATLALPYERAEVFKQSVQFSLKLLLLWCDPRNTPDAETKIYLEMDTWLEQCQLNGLAPNSLRFALSARARDIPVQVKKGILQLGWGYHARKLLSSFTDATNTIATGLARSKLHTNVVLSQNAIPVPTCVRVNTAQEALNAAERLGWPVVIKPANLDQSLGVTPDIRDQETLRQAFETAQQLSPGNVLLENHVAGNDYRLLVVGGKLLMATHRIPAGIVGDGHSTISALIARVNNDPRRGTKFRSLLVKLNLDEKAQQCLAEQGLCGESIPHAGQIVRLRKIATIGTGGTPEDVTARIHPYNKILAERAARLIGLDIAGVDFLCPDISKSWREVGGAINEVNAQPGFRPHWLCDPNRDINGEILDWMFRDHPARIPTAAIAGTHGQSTIAKMLHQIWMFTGKQAGVCVTEGIWIGDGLVTQENLTGYLGGRLLLDDPLVEIAIMEIPHTELRSVGHPCDHYDVAALLNVQNNNLSTDGFNLLEMPRNLQSEVLVRARNAVVVNADDPLCLASLVHAGTSRHVMVAMSGHVQTIQDHLVHKKGEAVFISEHAGERYVVLAHGLTQKPLVPINDITTKIQDVPAVNEHDVLFAVALAWTQGVSPESICTAMKSMTV